MARGCLQQLVWLRDHAPCSWPAATCHSDDRLDHGRGRKLVIERDGEGLRDNRRLLSGEPLNKVLFILQQDRAVLEKCAAEPELGASHNLLRAAHDFSTGWLGK